LTSESALRWFCAFVLNVTPPGPVSAETLMGQPVRSLPSSRLSAWISCVPMSVLLAPATAPATKIVRAARSTTGVLRIPTGWMLPHPAPDCVGAVPMLCIHTMAPVASSSAYTLLFVAAAMKTPLAAGPFST
jgi:hypothetical protein